MTMLKTRRQIVEGARWKVGGRGEVVRKARRATEGKGVYLAFEKYHEGPDVNYLLKVGKTGDGGAGFQSRAGELASEARKATRLDIEHAEIGYVIDLDTPKKRAYLEKHILDFANPIYGKEFFDAKDYPVFKEFFETLGRPYTVREDYEDRKAEFDAWRGGE